MVNAIDFTRVEGSAGVKVKSTRDHIMKLIKALST